MKIKNIEQLELTIPKNLCRARRRNARQRAALWFERMRQIVDRAIDWHSAPPPRPEQIALPELFGPAAAHERQLTE